MESPITSTAIASGNWPCTLKTLGSAPRVTVLSITRSLVCFFFFSSCSLVAHLHGAPLNRSLAIAWGGEGTSDGEICMLQRRLIGAPTPLPGFCFRFEIEIVENFTLLFCHSSRYVWDITNVDLFREKCRDHNKIVDFHRNLNDNDSHSNLNYTFYENAIKKMIEAQWNVVLW